MTKEELLMKLVNIQNRQKNGRSDIEADHAEADGLLLRFIDDPEITVAFENIEMWYA